MESLLANMNSTLCEYAPLKSQISTLDNSCLSEINDCQNNLLKRFISTKDPETKEDFHGRYKDYRNMISTLLKKAKQTITSNISKPI